MLNGVDPILIFQFSKLVSIESQGVIAEALPIVSRIPTVLEQPPIPIYLSERLTGLFLDTTSKNVNIDTDVQPLSEGGTPDVNQRGVNSSITINLKANKKSLGISLLSAMIDLCFEKLTSKEYAVSYLNGSTTIFRGLIQDYSVDENANDELLNIRLEISKGKKTTAAETTVNPPEVQPSSDAVTLGQG